MKHVDPRFLTYKNLLRRQEFTRFPQPSKKMFCKFAFLALLCVAQGFAFQPLGLLREKNVCSVVEIPLNFQESVHELDEVRDEVSVAAMDAYAKGNNVKVVLACFAQEGPKYIQLGLRMSEMVENASKELASDLGATAIKYQKLMEVPMKKIAVTLKELPEKVYNFIKEEEFGKAFDAMRDARNIVRDNSKIIAQYFKEMANEVPAIADKADKMAKDIYEESKKTSNAIIESFKKCVEEGGPKNSISGESDFSEE